MRPICLVTTAILCLAVGMSSCEEDDDTTPSSVAKLVKMSCVEDSDNPALGEAEFTIEQGVDTGLVYNIDSLTYGTDITSVKPQFSFEETPGSAILQTPDTTISLSGSDSIDMSKSPIYLTVISEDGSTTKTYEIQINVEQVDHDLWVWTQMTPSIWDEEDCVERALWLQDQFVVISNNGFSNHAYSSADAITWADLGEPTNLPANCRVRQIVSDSTTLYYADEQAVYTSTDAKNWTKTELADKSYTVQTMVMYWNKEVWAIVKKGEQQYLAQWKEGAMEVNGMQIEGDLPVSDFAAVSFTNLSGRPRAMIIGGYSENGESLNTRWNIEYSPSISTNGGYRIVEYSIDRPTFTSLTGIEVAWYGEKLYLFGGVDNDMQYFGRDILVSEDEGLNWQAADTTKNCLPISGLARQNQSVVVKNQCIYLFGGEDQNKAYSDVWKGRWNQVGMEK